MVYLGVDAGYSATEKSTGLCLISPTNKKSVQCVHVRTRETLGEIRKLLTGNNPQVVSIDGPLVPNDKAGGKTFKIVGHYRACEKPLSGGIFQKRCKPGQTSSPRGQFLHQQATWVANELLAIFPRCEITESFPNAFLGVLLPDSAFQRPIPRGSKSDVFWEWAVVRTKIMRDLLDHVFPTRGDGIFQHCREIENHDERAAFVCALAARCSQLKSYVKIDGGTDGAISLPPRSFIQAWALSGLGWS